MSSTGPIKGQASTAARLNTSPPQRRQSATASLLASSGLWLRILFVLLTIGKLKVSHQLIAWLLITIQLTSLTLRLCGGLRRLVPEALASIRRQRGGGSERKDHWIDLEVPVHCGGHEGQGSGKGHEGSAAATCWRHPGVSGY